MSQNLKALLPPAERILRDAFGCAVELGEPQLLKDCTRTVVARVAVCNAERVRNAGRVGIESVIVKHLRDEDSTGFTDWASLEFLAHLPEARTTVPQFYGGDIESRCFVLEDLGGSLSLEDVLSGEKKFSVLPLLRELARRMARLQAATIGHETLFTSIRGVLPAADGRGRVAELERWLAGQTRVNEWFAGAAIVPSLYAGCVREIAEVFRDPGEFLMFSHGDPAPSNNHVRGDEVRLLDFEYGGYRHALYDITAWAVLCPLPGRVVDLLSENFRAELAKTCPLAGDETAYREAWAHLCAYRALAILSWIPLTVLENDLPWAPGFTMRQAVLAATERLWPLATACPGLEPLGEAAAALVRALREKWPEFAGVEIVRPAWPVFETGI